MRWKELLKLRRISELSMHPHEKHLPLSAPGECCLRDEVKV